MILISLKYGQQKLQKLPQDPELLRQYHQQQSLQLKDHQRYAKEDNHWKGNDNQQQKISHLLINSQHRKKMQDDFYKIEYKLKDKFYCQSLSQHEPNEYGIHQRLRKCADTSHRHCRAFSRIIFIIFYFGFLSIFQLIQLHPYAVGFSSVLSVCNSASKSGVTAVGYGYISNKKISFFLYRQNDDDFQTNGRGISRTFLGSLNTLPAITLEKWSPRRISRQQQPEEQRMFNFCKLKCKRKIHATYFHDFAYFIGSLFTSRGIYRVASKLSSSYIEKVIVTNRGGDVSSVAVTHEDCYKVDNVVECDNKKSNSKHQGEVERFDGKNEENGIDENTNEEFSRLLQDQQQTKQQQQEMDRKRSASFMMDVLSDNHGAINCVDNCNDSCRTSTMLYVTKRNGSKQVLDPDKILRRLRAVAAIDESGQDESHTMEFHNNNKNVDNKNSDESSLQSLRSSVSSSAPHLAKLSPLRHVQVKPLCESVVRGLYDGVTTNEIDDLIAESAASLTTQHYEYGILAARIVVSNNHKMTPTTFSLAMKQLYRTSNSRSNNDGKKYDCNANEADTLLKQKRVEEEYDSGISLDSTDEENVDFLHPDLVDLIERRGYEIDQKIRHERDWDMTYFGYKTLERSYLLRKTTVATCTKISTGNSSNKSNNNQKKMILERPQYLLMRVALGIHCTGYSRRQRHEHNVNDVDEENNRLNAAYETYEFMSKGVFTHASPTLFHSGTVHPQLASCFLLQMSADSIDGIYNTLKQCALISKSAGGIGLAVHRIRARGTPIRGTRGVSNGLVPMLRVYDVTSRYVDQGGGKRPGAFAIYLEPWHADVLDVLNLKKNHGKEEHRARDLFYGLWIPDLFMERVQRDEIWSLMCPHQCPGLSDCYGDDFSRLYERYESELRFVRQIRARELWNAIIESQIETGNPYMLYKDSCNRKSNQQNLGTIQCSNLCTEIIQYTSPSEIAVCNLASICLSKFVVSTRGLYGSINPYARAKNGTNNDGSSPRAYFDHAALHVATKIVTRNLNKIIDINEYPLPEARTSNQRHRPIGIGVSGLADTFLRLGLPFTSDAAKQLNRAIFETIYHAALEASTELAEAQGPYESYAGSPASKGQLQFDLWIQNDMFKNFTTTKTNITDNFKDEMMPSHQYAQTSGRMEVKNGPPISHQLYPKFASITETATCASQTKGGGGYDWTAIRHKIHKYGLRNSLLIAPMPTASTAQILGVNECFEPFSSNLYIRRVKAGEFIMANAHLLQDLCDNGLWTQDVRNQLMRDGGSVQNIAIIPDRIKELYRTVWELKMRDIIDMAADRGIYIDQSQSLNLFIAEPTVDKLTAMHFYAWKKGLKTGMYYLRTKAAVNAIQYTVAEPSSILSSTSTDTFNFNSTSSVSNPPIPYSVDSDDVCLSCQA